MNEYRCKNCGRKLIISIEGKVAMYCPRCKVYNEFYGGYNSYAVVSLKPKVKSMV